MGNLFRTEPARVVAIVLALLGVLSAFGLGITHGQSDAIVSLVGAVLAILGGETVRAKVTPVAKLKADAVVVDAHTTGGAPVITNVGHVNADQQVDD